MDAELVLAPEAEQDIAEAYVWYERCRPGLGDEFPGCLDACVHAIRRSPNLFAQVHEEYQRALVRRFPYAVFYEHRDETVTVYCVFHMSRDPGKWRQRLP